MRRWLASDGGCASLWPRTGAPRRYQSSLGNEPYDVCLSRLKRSFAGEVASADRTDHISLRRFRLPFPCCLAASGLQIGLQDRRLICSSCTLPNLPQRPFLGVRHRVRARQAAGYRHGLDTRDPIRQHIRAHLGRRAGVAGLAPTPCERRDSDHAGRPGVAVLKLSSGDPSHQAMADCRRAKRIRWKIAETSINYAV
jgi:hypothetical protein